MRVTTSISKNAIQWSWDAKLRYTRGSTFSTSYKVDVSKTPKHLANYMAGLILSEIIAWNGVDVIFDELTRAEVASINDFVRTSYNEDHFKRVIKGRKCPVVKAKNIVEPYKFKTDGPVLCANGMGKDGLLLAMMVKEIGRKQLCFTVDGSYPTERFEKHKTSTNQFYKQENIKAEWINTTFIECARPHKCVARMIMGLPLLIYYNSNTILQAFNIGECTVRATTRLPIRPVAGIAYCNNIAKTLNIVSDAVQSGVTMMGSQKTIIERYPQVIKYQRSCMRADRWCGNCVKCYSTPLLTTAAGHDPEKLGLYHLKDPGLSVRYWKTKSNNAIETITYLECVKKVKGQPYAKWVDGINEDALKVSWESDKIGKIFKEHLTSYDYDPGLDGFGGIMDPSKWNHRMHKGFKKSWRRPK